MIRLIAFDMDGTVLNDEKKILKETKEALEQAARAGIEIVPATGRPFCGISDEIYRLDGVRYVLTTNGAGIYERDSKTCLYEDAIPLSAYLPMLAEVEAYDVMADTFLKGGALMTKRKRDFLPRMRLTKEIRDYILSSRQVVESQVDYLRERGEDVEKLTINFAYDEDGHRIDYDAVWEVLKKYPDVNAVSGGMKNIEVTKKGVSKASGLLYLGKKLGIAPEEMMVFGDSGNDLDMIKMAGIGVAMANAEPEVLKAADFVTKSNNENGVGGFLVSADY